MKTILDAPFDHHEPYPCRACGAMAVRMSEGGVNDAGIRFLHEHYPDGFYIQSCKCIDERVDEMEERRYVEAERAAINKEDWEAGGKRRKR